MRALLELRGVRVGGRAVDHDDLLARRARAQRGQQGGALQLADLHVVEGDVGVHRALREPVVGDDLHAGVVRLLHGGLDRLGVHGVQDQDLVALGQRGVDLGLLDRGVLPGVVVVDFTPGILAWSSASSSGLSNASYRVVFDSGSRMPMRTLDPFTVPPAVPPEPDELLLRTSQNRTPRRVPQGRTPQRRSRRRGPRAHGAGGAGRTWVTPFPRGHHAIGRPLLGTTRDRHGHFRHSGGGVGARKSYRANGRARSAMPGLSQR